MNAEPTLRARLADLMKGRVISQHSDSHGSLVCNDGEFWRTHIPYGYKAAHALLSRDLPGRVRIACEFHYDRRDLLTPEINHCTDTTQVAVLRLFLEGNGLEGDFFLNLTDGYAFAKDILVAPHLQGHGVGRHIMRNAIEFAGGIAGMDSFHLVAGMSAGGYAWGKFGIKPTNLDQELVLKQSTATRFALLRPYIPAHQADRLSEHARLSNASDIRELCNSGVDIASPLRRAFESADTKESLSRIFSRHGSHISTLHSHRTQALAQLEQDVEIGTFINPGRYLLSGSVWDGHVSYGDEEQLRYIAAYSGGFSGQWARLNPRCQ